MDPLKKLRSELERGISRAWVGLTEGWREMLTRSNDALTQYVSSAKQRKADGNTKHFPTWALGRRMLGNRPGSHRTHRAAWDA